MLRFPDRGSCPALGLLSVVQQRGRDGACQPFTKLPPTGLCSVPTVPSSALNPTQSALIPNPILPLATTDISIRQRLRRQWNFCCSAAISYFNAFACQMLVVAVVTAETSEQASVSEQGDELVGLAVSFLVASPGAQPKCCSHKVYLPP